MEIVVKAFLQEPEGSVEVRRISISAPGQGNKGIFKETFTKVGNAFPGLLDKSFSLKWKDSDGDLVMMSSDEEMTEALSLAQNNPLKIFVTVEGVKEASSENEASSEKAASSDNPENVQTDATQEPSTSDKKESDKKESDSEREEPFFGPFTSGFCNLFGSRKRGHPSQNPRGLFGFHFGHMGARGHHFDNLGPRGHPFGHMGPRGHHFGHMGSSGHHFDNFGPNDHHFGDMGPHGHPFGHMGPRGHHFGHMGPRGHHFDHLNPRGHPAGLRGGHHFGFQMGMHGPCGGPDFFEGRQTYHPFHDVNEHFGHHFRHHHDRNHNEENSWKARLRDAVPLGHRRWAKIYIRTWRVQNLKNATSTSSDSDQEIYTTEAAGVPDAYAAWLDIILPKWHKRQGQDDASASTDKEKNPEEKNKLKASVPLEFRKWVKWYLARHFGKKSAPKFRKEFPFEGKMNKLKKNWKKSFKLQTLAVSIPSEHRQWARTFIRDWRQEHKVPDPRAGDIVSSESEVTEKKAADGSIVVPDDYAKWMRKFLTKWHLMKGQISGQNVDVENGRKGEFKDTVPKNFRKWVKCFLWSRYGKEGKKEKGNSTCQYEKWLQAIQKKWIQEQSKGCADGLVLTSSDDDDDVECSLKKLRLDHEKANKSTDSDNNEFEACRDWFNWQWDGTTAPALSPEGAEDSEQISPRLYKWMAKMMMKKQKKMMKKGFKHAMKAHKYGQQF